jgi:hypothetical protein
MMEALVALNTDSRMILYCVMLLGEACGTTVDFAKATMKFWIA